VLAILLLATMASAKGTLPSPLPKQQLKVINPEPLKRGRWHMAEDGHAVFCYGPVITLNAFFGVPRRVATQCRGRSPSVPLHD
jgi:hypothetical protein